MQRLPVYWVNTEDEAKLEAWIAQDGAWLQSQAWDQFDPVECERRARHMRFASIALGAIRDLKQPLILML